MYWKTCHQGLIHTERDSDNNIDANDVWSGTFAENGALRSAWEDYRKVLTAMAEGLDAWINRRDITKKAGVKKKTVDEAKDGLHATPPSSMSRAFG